MFNNLLIHDVRRTIHGGVNDAALLRFLTKLALRALSFYYNLHRKVKELYCRFV